MNSIYLHQDVSSLYQVLGSSMTGLKAIKARLMAMTRTLSTRILKRILSQLAFFSFIRKDVNVIFSLADYKS